MMHYTATATLNMSLFSLPQEFEAAIPLLERASGLEPDSVGWQLMHASCLWQVSSFQVCTLLPRSIAGAWWQPSDIQIGSFTEALQPHRPVQALVKYREVLAAHPDNAECLGALAQISSSLGAPPASFPKPFHSTHPLSGHCVWVCAGLESEATEYASQV